MPEQVSDFRSFPDHPVSSSGYSCLLLQICSRFPNRIWSCLSSDRESLSSATQTLLRGTKRLGYRAYAGTRSNLHHQQGTSHLSYPCSHGRIGQIQCRLGFLDSFCFQKTFIGLGHWELGSSSQVLASQNRISSLGRVILGRILFSQWSLPLTLEATSRA